MRLGVLTRKIGAENLIAKPLTVKDEAALVAVRRGAELSCSEKDSELEGILKRGRLLIESGSVTEMSWIP